MVSQTQWEKMNRILLKCGSVHDAHLFSINAFCQLQDLVPFDQGRAYFINDNAEIYDEFLIGVTKRITKAYHEYYSKLDDGLYSASKRVKHFHDQAIPVHDWSEYSHKDEFFTEHLQPQGIRYSTGFVLKDLHGSPKVLYCLDRTSHAIFSKEEREVLYYLSGHLNNLYCNFYVPTTESVEFLSFIQEDQPLTNREGEIAELLSRGVSPLNIAEKLCISRTTVYKHISHIHEKLNVTNRQELVVKILNKK